MDTSTSSGQSVPHKLTAEADQQFQEGIDLLFSRWTALQMAVQNQWGGPHSHLRARQIISDVFSLLTQSKERVYIDDVEDMLEEAMLSLSVEVDDGSIEEIAEKLMLMHEECLEGNFSSIQRLRETNAPRIALPNVGQVVDDSDDDANDDTTENMVEDGSSEMAVDVNSSHQIPNGRELMTDESKSNQLAEAAEDGWTKVAPKRNKGRRN
ncbi:hypothetical protein M9H77_24723 [Catharanthus roseus]|uniref:Uncharacterized protein n=1 Tax=Catharanthus roseus TaxID=4058 RepID=A0ACC0A4W2_CATRO|nr:hypothetical protein M9H77_24723 [Catharanthus roseus]